MIKQSGLSLIELIVSLALGLLVSLAVFTLFVGTLKSNKTQDNLSRLQESARFALSQIQTDIRMSGYRGCLGRKGDTGNDATKPDLNIITNIQYHNDFDTPIVGYHALGTNWSPTLDSSISSHSPNTGSDIISIRYAYGSGAPLSAEMASSQDSLIPIIGNPDNLTTNDSLMISDCIQSTVFKPSQISATDITHTIVNNTTMDIGRAFSTDALVMPIKTVTYFVADSDTLTDGLSLWRKTNTADAEELANHIEQLKILYAEDLDGDLSPDKYVTANNVTDMKNVIAIKLMLLARTHADNLSANGQQYTFNGEKVTAPGDKHIRRGYQMTITIRNRAS